MIFGAHRKPPAWSFGLWVKLNFAGRDPTPLLRLVRNFFIRKSAVVSSKRGATSILSKYPKQILSSSSRLVVRYWTATRRFVIAVFVFSLSVGTGRPSMSATIVKTGRAGGTGQGNGQC